MIATSCVASANSAKTFAPISLVGNHTTLKANGYLTLYSLFQGTCEHCEVSYRNHLCQLLGSNELLSRSQRFVFALFFLFLLILKFELTVVHNFICNRRFCLGLNQYQVNISVVRKCLRFAKWFDTQLLTFKTD